jgi:hypothetical protein
VDRPVWKGRRATAAGSGGSKLSVLSKPLFVQALSSLRPSAQNRAQFTGAEALDNGAFCRYVCIGMEKSSAAQVIIAIIPIVGIVMGSVVAFFYLLWNHKRRVLLIKAGQYHRPEFDLLSFSLLTGILLVSAGASLTVFLIIIQEIGYGLLGGIIPLFMGIGLLTYYSIRRSKRPL